MIASVHIVDSNPVRTLIRRTPKVDDVAGLRWAKKAIEFIDTGGFFGFEPYAIRGALHGKNATAPGVTGTPDLT